MTASARNFSQAELDKFDELAQRWWDPDGPQKALHALNPARLGYVAERVPLRDAAVLDVGCGGGLLSEALAQAGAKVTAIDLAPNLLKVARLHGLESGIKVDYREMAVEVLAEEVPASFDAIAAPPLITAMLSAMAAGRAAAATRTRRPRTVSRRRVGRGPNAVPVTVIAVMESS